MQAVRKGGLVPKGTALDRACRAWQTNAVLIRGGLRRMGVHGPLRTLDEIASGERGVAAPKGMAMLAYEMAAAGCSVEEREERLVAMARMMARVPDALPQGAA